MIRRSFLRLSRDRFQELWSKAGKSECKKHEEIQAVLDSINMSKRSLSMLSPIIHGVAKVIRLLQGKDTDIPTINTFEVWHDAETFHKGCTYAYKEVLDRLYRRNFSQVYNLVSSEMEKKHFNKDAPPLWFGPESAEKLATAMTRDMSSTSESVESKDTVSESTSESVESKDTVSESKDTDSNNTKTAPKDSKDNIQNSKPEFSFQTETRFKNVCGPRTIDAMRKVNSEKVNISTLRGNMQEQAANMALNLLQEEQLHIDLEGLSYSEECDIMRVDRLRLSAPFNLSGGLVGDFRVTDFENIYLSALKSDVKPD